MDSSKFKKDFERDGFVILDAVLSSTEVKRAKKIISALQEWEQRQGGAHFYDETGKVQRVWNLLAKHPLFVELIQNPLIHYCMEIIFDRPTPHHKFYLSSFQSNTLHPGASEQKIHIDTPFPEPLPPWPIKANTIWLLDDFTQRNGSTEVVAGSHRLPYKPTEKDVPKLVQVIAPAGSVLVTHGNLWHRSGRNQTDQSRTVLLGSFAASYAREIAAEEDQIKSLSPEFLSKCAGTLRKILAPDHGLKPGGNIQPSAEILKL